MEKEMMAITSDGGKPYKSSPTVLPLTTGGLGSGYHVNVQIPVWGILYEGG